MGVIVCLNLRAFLPPGVLTGVSFGLLVLSVFVVLLVSMQSVPAAMGGYSVLFCSGGVDRLSIPACGDACTGVRCSCLLLGELTGDLFEFDFKLGEAFSRLLVLMSGLLSLLGRLRSNAGLDMAPSSCLVGVLVVNSMKSSVVLEMLLLAVVIPRLLVCGIKFSTLVSVTFVTLSSVEPLVASPRLGWILFPGMMLLGGLLSGGVPWTVLTWSIGAGRSLLGDARPCWPMD